jgi:uncharacterized protein YoxC
MSTPANRSRKAYRSSISQTIRVIQGQIKATNDSMSKLAERRAKLERDLVSVETEVDKARVLIDDLSKNLESLLKLTNQRSNHVANRNNGRLTPM